MMKIYPVKNISHLDYLTSNQGDSAVSKVVYSDVGEEDGWIHRIIIDQKERVWVRWVQKCSSAGYDIQLLTERGNMMRFFIVGEKLFVYQVAGWFGWKQFQSLIEQAKYGKNVIQKQKFNQIELKADFVKKGMMVRQVFKFNSDIYAIFSYERGFIVKKLSINSPIHFEISLQKLNFNDNYSLEAISIDKSFYYGRQSSELVLCLLIKTKKKPIQCTIMLVLLNIDKEQGEMQSQIAYQFTEQERYQNKKISKLKMCILEKKFLISVNNILLIGEDNKTKWIISKEQPIEACTFVQNHPTGQHIIVLVHEREHGLQICLYEFYQVLNFCQLSPQILQINHSKAESFVGVMQLFKEGRATGLLINLTNSNYLLSFPILSLSRIITNNRRNQQQNDESFEQDLFYLQPQQTKTNTFIGIKLQDFRKLIDSKNISLLKALKQLTSSQQILINIQRPQVDSTGSKLQYWIKILELVREYTTIYLYLSDFMLMLKQSRTGRSFSLPKNIKRLLELCQDSKITSLFDEGVSQDMRYYNQIITCLSKMRPTVILFSCLLHDGNSAGKYEISTRQLLHRRIILELGLQNIIGLLFNVNKMVGYLIYKMCVCKYAYALEQMLQYQHLLRHILTRFTDYHPLVYLLANRNQQYLFNQIHMKNCLELIAYQKKQNEVLFEGNEFVRSVYTNLQKYLQKHNLQKLTIFSSHISDQQSKYEIKELSIPIFELQSNDHKSQKYHLCKQIDFQAKMVGDHQYLILNQRQILQMVEFMNNYRSLPELFYLFKDKVFVFGQTIQLLNSQLLSTLKILFKEAMNIRQYNLQFKYSCQFIPNQQYQIRFPQGIRKSERNFISENRDSSIQTVIFSYLKKLHYICCSFSVKKLVQLLSVILQQKENHQQKIEDCSFISLKDSRISQFDNSFDFYEIDALDEKEYIFRMKDAFEKLHQNLTREFDVEEEVSHTIFPIFMVKFRRHLVDQIQIYESMKRNVLTKENQLAYEWLFKVASNRNKYKISLKKQISNKKELFIQSRHIQNLLELCLKYRLSCLSEPIDLIEELFCYFFLLKPAKFDETDYYGLHSVTELFDFENLQF